MRNKMESAEKRTESRGRSPFFSKSEGGNKTLIIIFIIIAVVAIGAIFGSYYYSKYYHKNTGLKTESEEIDLGNGITVKKIDSQYKVASGQTSGSFDKTQDKFFKTGQAADMMLSGFDFNNTGGSLHFNHLGGIASDGQRLILADRNNNRVLIWNNLPEKNSEPDLVLGQKDFITNNPGEGLDSLNWPIGVATGGNYLIVTDTYNNRVLIWNSFPTQNGQQADLELKTPMATREDRYQIRWPWQVWTDGKKLIVTSTGAARVLIWNSFPTANTQEPDIVLALSDFGTPRSVGSDGQSLIIGDHNAKVNNNKGNFFWSSFPTQDNQKYDFFMADVQSSNQPPEGESGESVPLGPDGKPLPPPENSENNSVPLDTKGKPLPPPNQNQQVKGLNIQQGEIFWSPIYTTDGKLIVLTNKLSIWNSFPQNAQSQPDLEINYSFMAGDGSGMALIDNKLYISLSNGNKIIVFNSIPTKNDQKPDFAIGSLDINTNTLETDFIISNPVPASNGKNLFVTSDFDSQLYVWNQLPDQSGAHPNWVYSIPGGGWDNALYKDIFAFIGGQNVYIWKSLPINGQAPDIILPNKIGDVTLNELKGVAIDEKYFYLADTQANKIYIWEDLPDKNSKVKYTLNINQPQRLDSNGKYLVVITFSETQESPIKVYEIDNLSNNSQASSIGQRNFFNLPEGATLTDNSLFVGDTGNNRVQIWKNIEDAIAQKKADTVLGFTDIIEKPEDSKPFIGRDNLFWPANPFFDGSYLWVGEFKFSERLLRFSPLN